MRHGSAAHNSFGNKECIADIKYMHVAFGIDQGDGAVVYISKLVIGKRA